MRERGWWSGPTAIAAVLAVLAVLLSSFGVGSTSGRAAAGGAATPRDGVAAPAAAQSMTDAADAVAWVRGFVAQAGHAVRTGVAGKASTGKPLATPGAPVYLLAAALALGLAAAGTAFVRGVRARLPQGRAPPAFSGS